VSREYAGKRDKTSSSSSSSSLIIVYCYTLKLSARWGN